MEAAVLGLAAVVLILVIARVADGEGTAAVIAGIVLKIFVGIVILAVLIATGLFLYIVYGTPHSPPLI